MSSITKICATLLLAVGLCLGGVSIQAEDSKPSPTPKTSPTPKDHKPSPTPKPQKPSPTPKPPKPTPTPKPGKCVVCEHEGGKNRDKQVDCNKVDEFLSSHPS